MVNNELKRGTAELAILSVLAQGPLHGYEIARQIEEQSGGALGFSLAALYPMLYRMESRGWLRGNWETSGSGRRRRCYRLLPRGEKMIVPMRNDWENLQRGMRRLQKVSHA